MAAPKALIIDDERDICELIKISLSSMNIESILAQNYQQGIQQLKDQPFHFCLTDMRLPDGDGLDIIQYIQHHHPELPVAVITAHGTMDSAITALKRGAFDFVSKPIDLQILRDLALTALKLGQETPTSEVEILGTSKPIQILRETVKKVSRSCAPVYISGPSGSGKELVARMIHQLSPCFEAPFIPVNCGAIPKELMESEFFGYLKGSFTGAHHNKQGLFQAAHKGTLLLDEVADLSLDMQVKLLRAIQERSIRPIGASKEVNVDVRILSATHQNLYELVKQKKFREDLFYRLNVIELKVPSLKERIEDIPLLIYHILKKLTPEEATIPNLDSEALSALKRYDFPGNVRELENILERAYALSNGITITHQDLHLPKSANHKEDNTLNGNLEHYLDDIEKQALVDALKEANGNKTQAAKKLGLTFRAFRYRLNKYHLK